MKKYILFSLFLSLFVFGSVISNAQCTGTYHWPSSDPTAPTTIGTPLTISTGFLAGDCTTMNGIVSGSTYSLASSGGGNITVRSGSCSGTIVANGGTPLTFTATSSGTYYISWCTGSTNTITLVSTSGGGSGCTYSICLYDTYGDSWNGGTLNVQVGGINVLTGISCSGAGPDCFNFTVAAGQAINLNYTAGSWPYENYYRVYDGSGTQVFASTQGSTPATSQSINNTCGPPPTTVTISPASPQLGCTGTVTLTANASGGTAPYTYAWSGGGTGSTKIVSAAGPYTVTVLNSIGGSATASVTVTSNTTPPPSPTINNLSGATALDCNVSSVNVNSAFPVVTCTAGNYTFQYVTGTYTPISGTTLYSGISDDNYYDVTLPFTFTFACQNFTTLSASTNGHLNFNSVATLSGTLGSGSSYNYLAFWWQDGYVNGNIQYQTTGTAPNRVFTVQYTGIRPYGGSTLCNIQIKLYETSNVIEYIYGSGWSTIDYTYDADCGLQSYNSGVYSFISVTPTSGGATTSNTIASQLTTTHASYLTSGKTFRFTPPVIGDYSYAWNGGTTPNLATNTFTAAGNYIVTVTNTANGCTNSANINISQNLPVVTNVTATPNPICLGSSTNLNATATGATTINWFTQSSGGTAIGTSASGANFSVIPTGTTTYYAEAEVASAGAGLPVNFPYTGAVQQFTVPATGTYKLEVWGAQGGDGTSENYNASSTYGGRGGYSNGEINLVQGEILYIYVGGAGTSVPVGSASSEILPGGYNGGGYRSLSTSGEYGSSGGGATHVATMSGLLSTLSSNQSSVLIVAGGGGGHGEDNEQGGAGGGTNGIQGSGQSYTATAGSQVAGGTNSSNPSANGSFGQGGNTIGDGGGGGGGWYGGASPSYSESVGSDGGGGSGGSGYIKPTLSNAQTIAGNISFTSPVSGNEIGHSGNGYARITPISVSLTCVSARVPVIVTINPGLSVNISPNPATITCANTSVNLTANASGGTGTYTYSWSGGSPTNVQQTTISTAGPYTVNVTSGGCTGTASITVSSDITPPTAGINPPATTEITCNTPSITLTATGGGTYSWSNGLGSSANATVNTSNISGTSQTFYVTVTGANGCNSVASIPITKNITPPTASINTPTTTELTCTTTSIGLTATGGGTYAWNNGLGNLANATVLTQGNYVVIVTNPANGCTASDNITITQNTIPPTATIANPTSTELTCSTTTIDLIATGGGTYNWSNSLGTNNAVTVSSPATYAVTVTGANGCTASANKEITQNITPPTAGITPPTTTILTCATTSISLTATGGVSYLWSTGATTSSISVSTPNTYYVTVTGANGCTATTSIPITQNITIPTVAINSSTTELTCAVTSISLTATGGGTYLWGMGETTNVINVNSPTTYYVTVTAANGCTASANKEITQNTTPPTAGITNNTGTN
ncbi:MAG: hypothetical protein LBV69_05720, partial [Bacteroidales bacterium]|nr:hypothetical protein [Bacteroidales bacterium]